MFSLSKSSGSQKASHSSSEECSRPGRESASPPNSPHSAGAWALGRIAENQGMDLA